MEFVVCSYGCGKPSNFFFKSGKGCCCKSPNSCEGKRKKDSEKKKGNFNGTPYWQIENNRTLVPWNKGKIGIYSEEYRKKISNSLRGRVDLGRASTPEKELLRKTKISESMKNNPKSGGLRRGSGNGKKGWYKGYWCDSSWELAWVIYNLDHGINFVRNTVGFEYEFKNKKRKYFPDFLINEIYYEIKGRRNYEKLDEENKEKIRQFNKEIIILFEKDMKPYLNYVIDKYGKNYISLYENGENPNW